MVRLHERHRAGACRRAGFTLIELLVVIALIAVLVALTAGAIAKFVGVQPVSNTKVTLKKLNVALQGKWKDVTDQARREPMLPNDPCTTAAQAVANLSPTSANSVDLTRLIYIKIKQKQAFPETYAEAIGGFTVAGVPIPPDQGIVQELKKHGITAGSTPPQNYESAVLLLMVLKRGGRLTDEALGANNISTNIAPGNVPCLIDAWGYPLAFTRWPVGNANATAGDPTDPQGMLAQMSANAQNAFRTGVHAISASPKLTPMLASMGSKGWTVPPILDLSNPGQANHWTVQSTTQAQKDQVNDIIYSTNLP
jgi:prepilin-type N-terminal cleavage/methylation domain-containing protein